MVFFFDGGEDRFMDEDIRESVASVFKAVGHPTRVELLEAVVEDKSMNGVAEELGVSYGTVQDHMDMLRDAELVYKGEGSGFDLTPVGKYVFDIVERDGESISVAVSEMAEAEKMARQQRKNALEEASEKLDHTGE